MSSPRFGPRGPTSFRLPRVAVMVAGAFLVAGCSEYSFTVPDPLEAEEVVWASHLGIHLSDFEEQPSGLWIREDQGDGEGDPATDGDTLRLEYQGWLPDGRMFDSSQNLGPLEIRLGSDPLIAGFEEGITGMRVNEIRTLLIPPWLGYGPQTGGLIPPNSWLAFRVELVARTPAPEPGG
jgi:FKBP-type peptidyl-prolyl cis-trans isomerase FkpA